VSSPALGLPQGYTFRATIARTPSSDIMLADAPGDGPVAVKVLRLDAGSEDGRLFVDGNLLAARIDHPHLIRVLATGELDDGRPWVAMPHFPAGSLADRLRDGPPITLDEVLHVGVRLADVLERLHTDTAALHRDVKPGNVLVGADGEPVLADLHVAGRMTTATGSVTTDRRSLGYRAMLESCG
jgi:non-specific serine/threonine protein kinase